MNVNESAGWWSSLHGGFRTLFGWCWVEAGSSTPPRLRWRRFVLFLPSEVCQDVSWALNPRQRFFSLRRRAQEPSPGSWSICLESLESEAEGGWGGESPAAPLPAYVRLLLNSCLR